MTTSKFTPTPEMISAAKAVFMAMAYTETVREVIEPVQKRLLQENNYKIDFNRFTRTERDVEEMKKTVGEYCRDWKYLYLIFDEDMSDLMNKAHYQYTNVLKFEVERVGYCPLLCAESLERDAKRLLVDIMQPITKLSAEDVLCAPKALENYYKLIDLTLRLLAPYCKEINLTSKTA